MISALSGYLAICAAASVACAHLSFNGLGASDPQGVVRTVSAVSADGSFVAGFTARQGASGLYTEAFRYGPGGFEALGHLQSTPIESLGRGMSWDGSVVVGRSATVPFRWTAGSGMQPIPGFAGGSSTVSSLSGDGQYVVGSINGGAVRWSQGGGVESLGSLFAGAGSFASAANFNGSVIVGASSIPGAPAGSQMAFRWTPGAGMVALGDIAGGLESSAAHAVNADGSVVVGVGSDGIGRVPLIWTTSGGPARLGDIYGQAHSVSGDGGLVVGSRDLLGTTTAFFWTQALGTVDLGAFLASQGALPAGWSLRNAYAVSADGRVIVGDGANPQGQLEGFIAVVPSPGTAFGFVIGSLYAWSRRTRWH